MAAAIAKSAVTYNRGTVEYKLLNGDLEEPSLRTRRANAHRPSPGEWLRITTGKRWSIELKQEDEQLFQYSRLDEGEIRILRLYQSKRSDDPLRADLFKRKLEDIIGRYEALSYCWGTQKPTHHIQIRDLNVATPGWRMAIAPPTGPDMWTPVSINPVAHTDFRIRKNLHECLLRLRSKYRDVFLWVDAICIDQSERGQVEKARQLAMMGRIYNSASNVCIWLGEGYDGAETAFGLVREIMNYRNFDEMILDPRVREAWRNLISIMKAPWFSRRWVIQEIALSRDASIHCGDRILHWDDFADAVSLLMEKIEPVRDTFKDDIFDDLETTSACILVQTLCNVCRKADQGEDQGRLVSRLLDVETLVSTLLGFQATFPRDTIYSILSLAKDFPATREEWQDLHAPQLELELNASILKLDVKIKQLDGLRDRTNQELETQPIGILPNYKFSPRDLFIAFVTRSIHVSGSLDILCRHWAPALTDDEGADTLPSWISSLSKSPFGVSGTAQGRQNGENFVAYLPHDQRRQYAASGMSQAKIEMALDPALHSQYDRSMLEINVPEFPDPTDKLETASRQLRLMKISSGLPPSAQPVTSAGNPPDKIYAEQSVANPKAELLPSSDDTGTHSHSANDLSSMGVFTNGQTSRYASRRASEYQQAFSENVRPKWQTSEGNGPSNGTSYGSTFPRWKLGQTKKRTQNSQEAMGSPESKQQHRLSGIISVQGFVLGTVVDQSEVMRGGVIPGEWVTKLGWEKDGSSENRVPDTLWRLLVADRMERGGKPPQWYKRACLHGLVDEIISDSQGNIHSARHTNRKISELTSKYFKRVESVVWNRRVFELKLGGSYDEWDSESSSEEGWEPEGAGRKVVARAEYDSPDPIYGLGPQECRVSDIVCILLGCSVPVILRNGHSPQSYKIVGEAYVHGMMDGEAMPSDLKGRASSTLRGELIPCNPAAKDNALDDGLFLLSVP
ncbi:heterokaryon incompatibility protein-domain-containing protein [Nemania sp. NC0429]|nr:heterokaryon incompatibility protein-domain-containing protein [Nemania sp. NC0429]